MSALSMEYVLQAHWTRGRLAGMSSSPSRPVALPWLLSTLSFHVPQGQWPPPSDAVTTTLGDPLSSHLSPALDRPVTYSIYYSWIT